MNALGPPPRLRSGRWWALGCLVAALYLPTIFHGFSLYDDPQYITENPLVRSGLSLAGGRQALTAFVGGNWHPVTLLSHMADVQIFGTRPLGHHLTSVVLHALATVLLAVVLRRLTGSVNAALLVSLLWGIHPVRVESVAWIAQRKDVLASIALGVTLFAYGRYVARPGPGRYATLFAAHAVGVATKPVLVTIPLLLLVLDGWPLGRLRTGGKAPGRAGVIREKIPLLVLSGAAALLTVFAQQAEGAVVGMPLLPWGARLGNALDSLVRYAGMSLWPVGLAAFYPHPEAGLAAARLAADGALLACVTLFALRQAGRRPWLAAGWAWYLVGLAPTLGVVQVGAQARADRYLTIPLLGLLAMLVGTAVECGRRSRLRRWLLIGTVTPLTLALLVATSLQIRTWRDDRTLFRHALAVAGESAVARYLLGLDAARRGDFIAAVGELRAALVYCPTAVEPRQMLADVLERIDRPGEAADERSRALAGSPPNPMAEADLGMLCDSLGRYEEAVRHLERAAAAGILPAAMHQRLEELRRLARATRRTPGKPADNPQR